MIYLKLSQFHNVYLMKIKKIKFLQNLNLYNDHKSQPLRKTTGQIDSMT